MGNTKKTLVELIHECGDGFRALIKHTDYKTWKDRPKWQAKANQRKIGNHGKKGFKKVNYGLGHTPEQAVYNLLQQINRIK